MLGGTALVGAWRRLQCFLSQPLSLAQTPLPGVRAEAVTFRRRCGQGIGLHAVQGSSQLLCESMLLEKP